MLFMLDDQLLIKLLDPEVLKALALLAAAVGGIFAAIFGPAATIFGYYANKHSKEGKEQSIGNAAKLDTAVDVAKEASKKTEETNQLMSDKFEEVHRGVNGQTAELKAIIRTAGKAEGVIEEKERQDAAPSETLKISYEKIEKEE